MNFRKIATAAAASAVAVGMAALPASAEAPPWQPLDRTVQLTSDPTGDSRLEYQWTFTAQAPLTSLRLDWRAGTEPMTLDCDLSAIGGPKEAETGIAYPVDFQPGQSVTCGGTAKKPIGYGQAVFSALDATYTIAPASPTDEPTEGSVAVEAEQAAAALNGQPGITFSIADTATGQPVTHLTEPGQHKITARLSNAGTLPLTRPTIDLHTTTPISELTCGNGLVSSDVKPDPITSATLIPVEADETWLWALDGTLAPGEAATCTGTVTVPETGWSVTGTATGHPIDPATGRTMYAAPFGWGTPEAVIPEGITPTSGALVAAPYGKAVVVGVAAEAAASYDVTPPAAPPAPSTPSTGGGTATVPVIPGAPKVTG